MRLLSDSHQKKGALSSGNDALPPRLPAIPLGSAVSEPAVKAVSAPELLRRDERRTVPIEGYRRAYRFSPNRRSSFRSLARRRRVPLWFQCYRSYLSKLWFGSPLASEYERGGPAERERRSGASDACVVSIASYSPLTRHANRGSTRNAPLQNVRPKTRSDGDIRGYDRATTLETSA
jgi:hypothetical protein